MGNNPGKSTKNNSSSMPSDIGVLTETFNENTNKKENENNYFDSNGFTNSLFLKVPSFGVKLFEKASKDSNLMDLYSFIKMANQFSDPCLLNSSESQIKLYLDIFSDNAESISLLNYKKLLRAAIDGSRAVSKIPISELSFDKSLYSFINSTFILNTTRNENTHDKTQNNIDIENLSFSTDLNFISTTSNSLQTTLMPLENLKSNLNNLLPNVFKDLHNHVVYRLFRRTNLKKDITNNGLGSNHVNSSLLDTCSKDHSLMGFTGLWLISSYCPLSFVPPTDVGNTSTLARITENNAWHILYNSNSQGLSANGFLSKVSSYPGCSLLFLRFGEFLLVMGSDVQWKESSARKGGYNCFLIQLLPSFKLLQGNKNDCIFFNITNRTFKKALQFCGDRGIVLVEVDEGMSNVMYQGVKINLDVIEVWGCGGSSQYDSYIGQKMWEKKDTQKNLNRKLKIEEWSDSPDKILLGYGGIETNHAQKGNL